MTKRRACQTIHRMRIENKSRDADTSRYVKFTIVDYGDLVALTASTGLAGSEDGIGKTIVGGVGGVGGVSVGVGP